MPFGSIPRKSAFKNAIQKLVGAPLLIRRLQAPAIMRMLDCRKGDLILDLGCGEGYFAYEIGKQCRCVAVDLQRNRKLLYAAQRLPRLSYTLADGEHLPFKSGMFDKILLSSILQMVGSDGDLLFECDRVLKPEGIIVLTVPEAYIYVKALNQSKHLLNRRFGATKGYYRREEIMALLKSSGHAVSAAEYAPKRIGSLLYELQLRCRWLGRSALAELLYFLAAYPLAYFDRFDHLGARGCELVIKAVKGSGPKSRGPGNDT